MRAAKAVRGARRRGFREAGEGGSHAAVPVEGGEAADNAPKGRGRC